MNVHGRRVLAARPGTAYNPPMKARFLAVVVCLATLAGCTMWKQQKGWSGATGGEQLERLWWHDVQAGRLNELEKHMAATLVVVMPDAVRDRAGLLQHFRELEVKDYSLGDFVTQVNGVDLVVAYRATLNGKLGGQPVQVRLRCLSVWQETKDGWLLTAQSVAPDTTQ